jgi:lysophospholipase L1-like esterase
VLVAAGTAAVVVGALIVVAIAVPARDGWAARLFETHAPDTPVRGASAWHLVGLGDSIPAGDGCDGCAGFLELYGQKISRDTSRQVVLNNLGIGGSTSQDLLASLTTDGDKAASAVADADLITVTIGANDFNPMLDALVDGHCGGVDGLACFQPAMVTLDHNLTAILNRIWSLRSGRPTVLRVTGYWDVFIDGAVAAHTYGPGFLGMSAALTRQANEVIQRVATSEHTEYVDLYAPFKGTDGNADDTNLLAPDGDHPSQAGDQQIATALARLGYLPLRVGP